MKTRTALSLLALATLIPQLSTPLHAQGSLTPPAGAPAPVMKSIQEVYDKAAAAVDSRTPLVAGQPGVAIDANGTITISQPGSYYLTANLVRTTNHNGINVLASNVTLDLNGFSLIGTDAAVNANAISVASFSNITIRNGSIIGGTTQTGGTFTLAGWSNGINSSQPAAGNLRAADLIIRGVRVRGIYFGTNNGSCVQRCQVDTCGEIGISSHTVMDSIVRNTNNTAIATYFSGAPTYGMVSNCFAETVGAVQGARAIQAQSGTVINSRGICSTSVGIEAETVMNSTGVGVTGIGIIAKQATNCTGESTSGTGLTARNATNCFGSSDSGDYGISVTGTASFCTGLRSGGTAIQAAIAIGCTASGTVTAPQKHLGTP